MARSHTFTPVVVSPVPMRYVHGVMRIPSMSIAQGTMFTQLVGQYNRGLITAYELTRSLNEMAIPAGPNETVRFDEGWTGTYKLLLEPRFVSTSSGAIAFRIHFCDYI